MWSIPSILSEANVRPPYSESTSDKCCNVSEENKIPQCD